MAFVPGLIGRTPLVEVITISNISLVRFLNRSKMNKILSIPVKYLPIEQYLVQFYQEDFGSLQAVHPLCSTKSRENKNSNISDRIQNYNNRKHVIQKGNYLKVFFYK